MVSSPGAPIRPDADDIRPVNQPQPVEVMVEGPRLVSIVVDGARVLIAGIQDVWLSEDEWWRPVPIDRLYFAIVLENGRYLTIFRDRSTGRWYEQPYELP